MIPIEISMNIRQMLSDGGGRGHPLHHDDARVGGLHGYPYAIHCTLDCTLLRYRNDLVCHRSHPRQILCRHGRLNCDHDRMKECIPGIHGRLFLYAIHQELGTYICRHLHIMWTPGYKNLRPNRNLNETVYNLLACYFSRCWPKSNDQKYSTKNDWFHFCFENIHFNNIINIVYFTMGLSFNDWSRIQSSSRHLN